MMTNSCNTEPSVNYLIFTSTSQICKDFFCPYKVCLLYSSHYYPSGGMCSIICQCKRSYLKHRTVGVRAPSKKKPTIHKEIVAPFSSAMVQQLLSPLKMREKLSLLQASKMVKDVLPWNSTAFLSMHGDQCGSSITAIIQEGKFFFQGKRNIQIHKTLNYTSFRHSILLIVILAYQRYSSNSFDFLETSFSLFLFFSFPPASFPLHI